MNENRREMDELATQQQYADGTHVGSSDKDVGAVCETPRVIELGDVSERYCYNENNA